MFKKIVFLVFLAFVSFLKAQQNVQLSQFSEISIVTSGPGKALYEKFGHTAIRIKDPMLQLDVIYNYGMFDFNGWKFYLDFTRGFMKYKLARYPFHYSLQSAREDKRWVKQQVLNLTLKEKNDFFTFLEINASPKNASYFYDPFFNNCATKPRDIISKILKNKVAWSSNFTSNKSLRQLMNVEINQNTWGSLGINVALGSKLDKKITALEYLYLPDYVEKVLASSKIKRNGKEENLVQKTQVLLNFNEKPEKSGAFNPFLILFIFSLLGGYITFKDYKSKQRTRWLDGSLFFITGILGFLIVFLWFFTNHSTAPNNFNILWAFPFNFIVGFYLLKKNPPKWIKNYLLFLIGLLLIIPIIWLLKIQLFNWVLIPFLLLFLFRYVFLMNYYKTSNS